MLAYIRKSAERQMTDLLATADIEINGNRPWDIQIKNKELFNRVSVTGSLGLGEAYMDGWWECQALDQLFFKLLSYGIERKFRTRPPVMTNAIRAAIFNCQSRRKAFEVGKRHYDAGNDLFEKMLDPHMVYSCGYWKDAENLIQAQENKMEMICRKLMLSPGMKLLDIGCGWGGLIKYAAQNYGISAVGLTISKEQAAWAKERCAGLPVEIRFQDYREAEGAFDAVVSVGMFEHVGYKNHRTFMKIVLHCLKDEGLFLLHTIASNDSVRHCDPWIEKYIFPNSLLPSIKQMGDAMENHFIMEDWHNIGVDYDHTLMAWHENFEHNWHILKERYSERFYRMWRYYLLSLAGCFRSRYLQVWQVVMSPHGKIGGCAHLRCPVCAGN
jgi:cyclopropane-fatty-acyl-phospholipid synthase